MYLLTKLAELGFTEYEAKVYLALLDDYPATGYQISKAAGVPRSMVYEALGRLKLRGAVLETPDERATLYRPLPPDVLLDNHEQAQRRLVEELRAGLAGLYQGREEDRIWSISGREALLAYARELIGRAQQEIFLVLDDPDVAALEPAIAESYGRGVSTSAVLTGVAPLRCSQVVRHPPLESQLHELSGMLVVVVDGAEVLVAASAAGRAASATVTRNRNLVLIARQFVWMELFAQRIFAHMDGELLARLDPADRRVLESAHREEGA